MRDNLKDLLKIGLTNSIQSFIPVLIWILIGIIFDNSGYADGYIIVYPYQYIASLLYCVIFKSQLKREVKMGAGNHDNAYTGLKILCGFYALLFVASVVFIDGIFYVLNVMPVSKSLFIFGSAQIFMDWILYGIVTIEQYDRHDIRAFSLVVFWYVSKIVCIVILGVSHPDPDCVMTFVNVYMFTVIILLLVRRCRSQRVIFSIVDGFKYSIYNIPQEIGMFIVYVFGINAMATSSAAVLSAYNLMSMCTDTQWDILGSAIDTVGTLRIKTGEFVKSVKKLMSSAVAYSIILFISSTVLISLCYMIPTYRYSINFTMVWVMFIIECFGLPIYAIRYMAVSWVSIEHPNGYAFIITIVTYIARFITMYLIHNDYRVSIGIVASYIIGNTCHILLYCYYMRKEKNSQ